MYFHIGCFLWYIPSLLLCVVFLQVSLGSPGIRKELKTSCICQLKIAEVFGKVAADAERFGGSLHSPLSPSVGKTQFSTSSSQPAWGP